MTPEQSLREIEANLRAAQAQAAEKRHVWRLLTRGAWTHGEAYERFVLASIAYASAADYEAGLADAFTEAQMEAQAEEIRRERERQPQLFDPVNEMAMETIMAQRGSNPLDLEAAAWIQDHLK